MRGLRLVTVVLISLHLAAGIAGAQELVHVVPLKPDPPIAVDGDLGDWVGVPGAISLDSPEHATYKRLLWDGPEDLSATVHTAWRREGLFLALDITDDMLSQTQRGRDIWKGDHVEVYLDFAYDVEPDRSGFDQGQFQLAFSPGNFQDTGDPVTDIQPEVYCHWPEGMDAGAVEYAARRIPQGWIMEAMVPFDLLGVTAAEGLAFSGEVAVSDCDSAEAAQETMITVGTEDWVHSRHRLQLMALGSADGEAEPPSAGVTIADELLVPAGEQREVTFEGPEVPPEKAAYLFFRARIINERPAGWTTGLRLTLNGTTIEGQRLTNRPATSMRKIGIEATFIAPTGEVTVPYGPDFEAADRHESYGLLGGVKIHEYEFEVADLLADGENTLQVQSLTDAGSERDIAMGDLQLRIKAPPPPPPPRRPAPTGPLPVIQPRRELAMHYTVTQTGPATLEVKVGGERFTIESRFSAPDGQWHAGGCQHFSHARRIERSAEHIVVHDSFTNLTDELVPVMQRHACDLGDRFAGAWLAGIHPLSGDLTTQDSGNPSSYATTAAAGLGMVPLSDEFRIHVTNSCLDGVLGLADNNFVLQPGAEYTAEWMVVPTAQPDFWAFVNAARRALDSNFTLQHQFGFLSPGTLTEGWDDETLTRFIRNKGLDVACATIGRTRYKGRVPHGTAFQHVDHQPFIDLKQRIRRLCPDVQFLVYFHCFLDVRDEAESEYHADRRLRSNGEQGIYSREYMRIFNPTLDNTFGPAVAGNIDIILDEIGAEGVYWDEVAYSKYKYHYGEPWDGCSADIDPESFQVQRLKSAVSLIALPFQLKHAQRIMEHGPLVTNGMPRTRTLAALKFQAFTETGSISNCLRTLLYSPIALGDHRTERTIQDAYHWMVRALDYGCVYNWYSQRVFPEYPTLASHMFPITPVELHEGYIIGEERIITNRSGLFGWGDDSRHEVRVFDEDGREVEGFDAPLQTRDGSTFTELRIAEGYSAAIIRQPAQ
ncbi:MAG: sugar-binding protein [Armatimonadota bacterium]|nr:sugar-binding protein [Armatimonadota bacterium]